MHQGYAAVTLACGHLRASSARGEEQFLREATSPRCWDARSPALPPLRMMATDLALGTAVGRGSHGVVRPPRCPLQGLGLGRCDPRLTSYGFKT